MTEAQTIRVDVRYDREDSNRVGTDCYRWVLQMTHPVRDLAVSPQYFGCRADAILSFVDTADLLGWKTMVAVDWEPPKAEVDEAEEPF